MLENIQSYGTFINFTDVHSLIVAKKFKTLARIIRIITLFISIKIPCFDYIYDHIIPV